MDFAALGTTWQVQALGAALYLGEIFEVAKADNIVVFVRGGQVELEARSFHFEWNEEVDLARPAGMLLGLVGKSGAGGASPPPSAPPPASLLLNINSVTMLVVDGSELPLLDATVQRLCIKLHRKSSAYSSVALQVRAKRAGGRAERAGERSGRASEASGRSERAGERSKVSGRAGDRSEPARSLASGRRQCANHRRQQPREQNGSLRSAPLQLLFCGKSGQNLGLSGGDPSNPPCGRRGRTCAQPHMCSAAHVLSRACAQPHMCRTFGHALGRTCMLKPSLTLTRLQLSGGELGVKEQVGGSVGSLSARCEWEGGEGGEQRLSVIFDKLRLHATNPDEQLVSGLLAIAKPFREIPSFAPFPASSLSPPPAPTSLTFITFTECEFQVRPDPSGAGN
jgi:hypothetical protein